MNEDEVIQVCFEMNIALLKLKEHLFSAPVSEWHRWKEIRIRLAFIFSLHYHPDANMAAQLADFALRVTSANRVPPPSQAPSQAPSQTLTHAFFADLCAVAKTLGEGCSFEQDDICASQLKLWLDKLDAMVDELGDKLNVPKYIPSVKASSV